MRSILREQWLSSAVMALITLALGVFLLVWPDRSINFLCSLLGAALLSIGLVYVLGWFVRRRSSGLPAWFLVPGVILAATGLWMLSSPQLVGALIQYVVAAVLVFHAAIDLQGALALASRRVSRWWVDLLLALVTLGLGVVILLDPLGSFELMVMLIGLALAFDGLSDLWLIFRLGWAFRAFKTAEEAPAEEPEQPEQPGQDCG